MNTESEVDFSSNSLTPLWRRRSTPQPQLLGRSKPRPQSYQSPSGLLITDFPVEDRETLPAAQSLAEVPGASDGRTVQRSPLLLCAHRRAVTNGRTVSPEYRAVSPRLRRPKSPQVPRVASDGSPKSAANGTATKPAPQPLQPPRTPRASSPCSPEGDKPGFPSSPLPSPAANGLSPGVSSQGAGSLSGCVAKDPERGPSRLSPSPPKRSLEQKLPLQRLPSPENELLENPSVVLSTNSPAALKVGKQQIIPKSLASEIKVSKSNSLNVEAHKRLLKVRSMVEGLGAPLGPAEDEGEAEHEADSPGSLRRGLRSTSYRRAVVSGVDFDSPGTSKKKNRMSQPALKAVVEDKEKFSSLGRIKKKMLKGQGTFDGEENAVLYQNYKEKALDIDSDEESELKEQKSDEKIVIHHKPLRSTWSQLSAAIFEVISSEHSYLLSLEILIRMFKNSKALSDTMTKTESHHLFSNITDVCEASKKLCNEGARKMERTEMMYTINSQLEFKIKVLCQSYNVNDYSLRDQLLVESCDSEELNSSPGKNSSTMLYSRQNSASHLFTLTVLSNHANEKVEMLLGAETQSERARWITALGHSSGKQPPDRTSLTQVEITRSFTAKQPDELSLQVADVVLIYQRVSDGWFEGERLRDGERGWFPMECAKEITCQATIDKNVERMGRLLGLETNV
ncbi:hypothetical protein FD755_014691 [Muntiacus reevesi]|uniref:SH3 domain-containing protein n=1 Tax=Muntiacus reevesi TaxID=9886 RepID=A0A5N3XMA2_MUNRE|nr:hypothetical protein FD755_014691 [Muntiacus reevesi]